MRNVADSVIGKKPKLRAFITDAANIYDESEETSGRINITDADLVSNSLTFTSSTSNSGEITVGAAIIGGCNLSLWNDTGKFDGYNWTNTVISIELIYENNVSVYMGYYYIVSHRQSGKVIRIEALDAFKIMDIHQLYEVGINWPAPASEVLTALANFSFTHGVTLEGIDDLSNIILYDPQQDQMPIREAISYIAQMCGKFATIRSTNITNVIIHFGWYDTDSAYDVGTTFSHDLRTDDITVSGVMLSDNSGEHTATVGDDSGYMIEITDNPFILANNIDAVAEHISGIVGLTFRPGSFAIENNAKVESGDAIKINTRDEQNINTLATTMTFKPFQLQESIVADCEAEAGDIQLSLANYIRKIAREEVKKGSGGDGGEGGLDPENAYRLLRPADWLEMPPAGVDEAFILYHVPANTTRNITIKIGAPSGTLASTETGTVSGGSFVSITADTQTVPDSGDITLTKTINSSDYGATTSTGFDQIMIRITTTNTLWSVTMSEDGVEIRANTNTESSYFNITGPSCLFLTWDGQDHKTVTPPRPQLKVARGCSLTPLNDATKLITHDITVINEGDIIYPSGKYQNCSALVYAGIENNNTTRDLDCSRMFENCEALTTLQAFKVQTGEGKSCTLTSMFSGCKKLAKLGPISSGGSLMITRMLQNCENIMEVGEITAKHITSLNYAFHNCKSLTSIKMGTLYGTQYTNSLFANCTNLRRVTLKCDSSTSLATTAFTGCTSLKSIIFENAGNWYGCNLDLRDCTSMTRADVAAMVDSLPTGRSMYRITLPAAVFDTLTEEDIAAASAKRYTFNSL